MLHVADEPTDAAVGGRDHPPPHRPPPCVPPPPPSAADTSALSASAVAALATLSTHPFDTTALPAYTPSAAHEARIASENLAAASAAAAAAADAAEAAEAAAAAAAASGAGADAGATAALPVIYPEPHYHPTLWRHPPHSDAGWEPPPPPRHATAAAAADALPASLPPRRRVDEGGTAGATGDGVDTPREKLGVKHRSRSRELLAGPPADHVPHSRRSRSRGRSVGATSGRSPGGGSPTRDNNPTERRGRQSTRPGGAPEVHWLDRALRPQSAGCGGRRSRSLDVRRGDVAAAPDDGGHHRSGRHGRDGRRSDRRGGAGSRPPRPHRRRTGAPPRSEPGRVPASVVIRRRRDPPPGYNDPCPDGASAIPVAPPIPSFGLDRLPSPRFEQPPNAPPTVHLSVSAQPTAAVAAEAAKPPRYAASSRWRPLARKALLIGAGYKDDPRAALAGPTTDVRIMRYLLTTKFGFDPADLTVLTDDPVTHDLRQTRLRGIPTRTAILEAMRDLVAGATAGDSLLVFFAGHGTRVVDTSGDEEDGFDEAIVPVDYATAGVIIDDTLHDVLVRPLPRGVRIFVLFDACHSATAVDLPYVFSPVPLTGGVAAVGRGTRSINFSALGGTASSPSSGDAPHQPAGARLRAPASGSAHPSNEEQDGVDRRGRQRGDDSHGRHRHRRGSRHRHRPRTSAAEAAISASTGRPLPAAKLALRASHAAPSARSAGLAISLSACADAGTASDARTDGGIATGAMTYAFVNSIEGAGPERAWASMTYAELLVRMRDTLHEAGHTQQTQISTNIPHFDLTRRLDGQW